jgi:transglutaminase-like putative cysteine protease
MNHPPLELTVRVGCHVIWQASVPVTMTLALRPREGPHQKILQEQLVINPQGPAFPFQDFLGNQLDHVILQPGENDVRHDAIVQVPAALENTEPIGLAVPMFQMPTDVLRYTLPSRYCDSDKLLTFAWNTFGPLNDGKGAEHVQKICDWVHNNIEYRFGSGSPEISASDVLLRRYGVCRDFAHVAIALCRCFNIPARYITGHLPDIGHIDPGTPMDFHAYFEAFLGQHWSTFDARYNQRRIGRVKITHGLDAVDGAFSTVYGEANIKWFEVWAYQINPGQVSLGDPVDLSKRLDGTAVVRRW